MECRGWCRSKSGSPSRRSWRLSPSSPQRERTVCGRWLERRAGFRGAAQPRGAFGVELRNLRAAHPRKSELHIEPRLRLQVAEVPVALRKSCEQLAIERELRARLDGIEAVLLVDRLPANDRPALRSLLEEVVEPPRADRVDLHSVDRRALVDRHLRLRDRAPAVDLDARRAEEMNDAHAAIEARAPRLLKLGCRSLEPRRGHPAVVVPDG